MQASAFNLSRSKAREWECKSPAVQLFPERFLQASTERLHRVHGATLQSACEKAGFLACKWCRVLEPLEKHIFLKYI